MSAAWRSPISEMLPSGEPNTQAQAPTWVVTGTDDVGVAAAAAALTGDRLEQHFALAVDQGQDVPLPVTGAGTGP